MLGLVVVVLTVVGATRCLRPKAMLMLVGMCEVGFDKFGRLSCLKD